MVGAALAAWGGGRAFRALATDARVRRVALLYGINGVTFTLAVFSTSVANVVFILALNPLLTALLSWWLCGERPRAATWAAIGVTLVGVAVIVGAPGGSGHWTGDALAATTLVLLAFALTLTRRDGLEMGTATLLAASLPAALGWIVVAGTGFDVGRWMWIALDGAVIMPLAFFCLAAAPRFAPAPLVAMAFLLETCLAPIWVWLALGERPVPTALAGGGLVLAGVLLHATSEWRAGRAARRPIAAA